MANNVYEKFESDKELLDFLRNTIENSTVSVVHEANEPIKQYSIDLSPEDMLTFSQSLIIEEYTRKPFIEYAIDINGQEILTVYINPNTACFTPNEQIVINLFQMCSRQIIRQEMQSTMLSLLSKNNYKVH